LRNKIIAWSFVPTAIILVAVALVSLYAYQQVTENLVIVRDRELTRLSARLLATELAAYTDPLADQHLAVFDGMVLFNSNGTILAAEPEHYEKWTPRWFKDISLHQVLQSSEPVFSDVLVDNERNQELVVVVIPLTGSNGESLGGMAGLFRLDPTANSALYRSVEKLRRGENNDIYLVDGTGQVIYHSNPELIGSDFSELSVVDMVLKGWAGSSRTQDFEGQEIVASFAPVPGTSWGLVTEESWATLTQTSRRYQQFLFVLLGLGVVIPIIIVTVGVRRITQPIDELIHAAQEIAGGRFGRRIKASTGDEVEELAEQFNLMADQLQESYAHLEQKVADRTQELATLNTIAAQVSQSLDLEQILNNSLDKVLEAMDMECGQAFRLEEESQILIPIVHRGLSDKFVRATTRLPLEASAAGQAAKARRPVVLQVADYPDSVMRELLQQEGVQVAVSTPLTVHRKMVGAINLGTRTPRDFSAEELSLLDSIGHQIGVAVENAQLYEQAQQLAVMKERNRLARDLHDSVTQALYGVTLYAEAAARQLASGEPEMAADHLREIRITSQESLREMRLLIFELRLPMLKRDGLAAVLHARLEGVEGRVGLETSFKADGDGRLPPDIEEGLYRIAQEALNNTLRHAQARSVSVSLHRNKETITLEIADDGQGFDPEKVEEHFGFGLRGMEERAARMGGNLEVESSPGQGTRIKVEVSI
jgi:signal transduction histidine kinase